MQNKNSKTLVSVLIVIAAVVAGYFAIYMRGAIPGVITPDTSNWMVMDYPGEWNQIYKLPIRPGDWTMHFEQYQEPGEPFPTAMRYYVASEELINRYGAYAMIYLGVPTPGTTNTDEDFIVATSDGFSYAVHRDAPKEIKIAFNGIVASTHENYAEVIDSRWVPFVSETLGISFMYPAQYGELSDPEVIMGSDTTGAQLYDFKVGENSAIEIYAVQEGWFGGEPSFPDALYSSDYSGCDAFRYRTPMGLIPGYKLFGGGMEGFCGAQLQGAVSEGYFIYVFDLERLPHAKIAFIVRNINELFAEEFLSTLQIYK